MAVRRFTINQTQERCTRISSRTTCTDVRAVDLRAGTTRNAIPSPGEQRYLILEDKVRMLQGVVHEDDEFAHDGGEGVAEIAPEANRAKGTLRIKVQILNPDNYLTPELSAKADSKLTREYL